MKKYLEIDEEEYKRLCDRDCDAIYKVVELSDIINVLINKGQLRAKIVFDK